MSEKTQDLGEALIELNNLAFKYKFSFEDRIFLTNRCFLLGEACAFLQDLGLYKELEARYEKAVKNFENKVMEEINKYER